MKLRLDDNEYNLNVIKEIKVTDSFLTLDEQSRGCQNKETYQVDCIFLVVNLENMEILGMFDKNVQRECLIKL